MNILGIDVGGTSIKGAIVNDKGKVLTERFSFPIVKDENQEDTINRLVIFVKEYLDKISVKVDGIGMGVPGSLDTTEGSVIFSNNLKWKDLEIVKMFKKSFDLPIKISNDANVAALGEAKFGAGKKYKNIVMITLGTGVGSGIVIDGKLYEGTNGKGAELGHTTLVYNGLECSCGRRGCLEMYASATALIRQTREAMERNKFTKMWDGIKDLSEVDGRTAFEWAKLGDKVAEDVVARYVSYLSEGLLSMCNVFRPECIVLSGGIANQGKNLTDKVKKYMSAQSYGYPFSPKTEIAIANLGYNSGIIGAAALLLK